MTTQAQDARSAMRRGEWAGGTTDKCPGHVQCNLVVLPRDAAFDFLVYCQRNQRACPVIEVTDPGDPQPRLAAPGADLRTDLPRYAVYRDGRREKDVTDIRELWTPQSVGFLIGSSLTFDAALQRAGVAREGPVWVLNTTRPTVAAGPFEGPLVVTMRWMTPQDAVIATQLTTRFPFNHGAPVHIGDPAAIGANLETPIFGAPVERIPPQFIPVFWACGVTPQAAAERARLPLMITHAPGHAFISDLLADRICLP